MFKKILISTFIAVIFLALGIFIGTKIKKTSAPSGTNNTYQAGWDAAKARLAQSPYGMSNPAGTEIKSVSGTIQKIDGNKFTVKISPLEPLADPNLDVRLITIDANTKISLYVQKDLQQLQKEMQEFQDKMTQQREQQAQENSVEGQNIQPVAPIFPPMPSVKKDILISELKEGQQISVTANENIKDKKEFVAIEVDAQDTAPPQAYAPASSSPVEAPVAVVPVTTAPATTSIK